MSEKESRRSGRRKIFTLTNGLHPIWRFVVLAAAAFVLFSFLEGNAGELGTEASLFMIPAIVLSFIYIARRYPRTCVA